MDDAIENAVAFRKTLHAGQRPVRSVLSWELRRLVASRSTLVIAACTQLFFVLILLFKHSWSSNVETARGGTSVVSETLFMPGSSPRGMLHEVIFVTLLLFGMFLPFVAADGVARDFRQRVHELLMTTQIPSAAYVLGRYLATMLLGLLLSLELLFAVYGVDVALHLSVHGYPMPVLSTLLYIWALAVVPATVLVASLSFMLGTLWPKLANIMKLAVLLGWIGIFIYGQSLTNSAWSTLYMHWDPTSYPMDVAWSIRVDPNAPPSPAQLFRLPPLHAFVLPHIGLVLIGFSLAAMAAFGFRRFRDVVA